MYEQPVMRECPFCHSDKLKVDSNKSTRFRYIDGQREDYYTASVRCNSCHARGPTASIWIQAGRYNATELIQYKAIALWNDR